MTLNVDFIEYIEEILYTCISTPYFVFAYSSLCHI